MKILQVTSTLDVNAGGPIEGLIQQGAKMTQAGHEVHTLTLDAPGLVLDPRLMSTAVYFLGPSWLGYRVNFRIGPWLRTHGSKYDVIVVHGMWGFHGYGVAKAARAVGLPYVIFLHGMLDPWFKHEYPLKHLKKWLYWPWAEYRTLRDARMVLFTTAEELRLARESFWLYKVRERLVGYGIQRRQLAAPLAREGFLARFPHLRDTRNILFLSRIQEKKGCDLLVNAFAKAAAKDPSLHLVMAGPDQTGWVAKLKAMATALGVSDRITYTGMLKGDEKWGAYDAADVFMLPSHQENFGIVVAEALASGVPVLTTFNVNIWREIKEAGGGIIHPDTQEGADAMLQEWLAMGDDERHLMRTRAVECFEKNFEIGRVTGNLLSALEEVSTGVTAKHTYSWSGVKTPLLG